MNFPVQIPLIPKDLYEVEDNPLKEILGDNVPTFFIDRFEYPESGGIYIHKFGAELLEKSDEVHRRVLTEAEIPEVEAEEAKLGFVPRETNVYRCDECNKIVAYFIPKFEFKNRVDMLYPVEGFPDPKVMPKINEAKRLLIGYVKFFANKSVILAMSGLLFLPFKYKVKFLIQWIKGYSNIVDPILHPYLQERYYQNVSKELRKFISAFLKALGVDNDTSNSFAKQLSTLIEFDSAYNLFIQDIMGETTKERLKNPRKEIQRLMGIFEQRTPNKKLKKTAQDLKKLAWILSHPRIKKAFKQAVNMLELKNLQLTEGNKYHVLKMVGYDFMGRTIDDRSEEYFKMHNDKPPIPHYI